MDYDPRSEPHGLAHDPGTCLVVPRPIGWITTISPAGIVNLAPYSFFNIISTKPPFVMFSSSTRKHSQRNAEMAGEFVFNLATYDLRTEMNITGSDHAEDISEAEIAGLAMVSSRVVKPPRVERSPIALECIYNKTVELVQSNGKKTVNSLIRQHLHHAPRAGAIAFFDRAFSGKVDTGFPRKMRPNMESRVRFSPRYE